MNTESFTHSTVLGLLLCCTLIATSVASDKTSTAAGTTIKILGQSGKMTITGTNAKAGSVQVTMDALREVDSSGNAVGTSGNQKHSFNTFASQSFTFSSASTIQFQNLTAAKIDFTATILSATFKVTTYIFSEAGTIVNDGEQSAVGKGTMKFSIAVDNWTWCTGANCKKGQTQQTGTGIEVDISIKGQKDAKKKNVNPGVNETADFVLGGGGVLAMSRLVQVDGAWKTMATGFPKLTVQGSKNIYTVRFPKGSGAGSKILYDPTITTATENAPTTSSASRGISNCFITIATVLSLVAMFAIN